MVFIISNVLRGYFNINFSQDMPNADRLAIQIAVILDGAIVHESILPNQNIIAQVWQITQTLIENATTP